jgi:hypothetical protein
LQDLESTVTSKKKNIRDLFSQETLKKAENNYQEPSKGE